MAFLLLAAVGTAGAQELSLAVVNTQEIYRAHPSFQEATQRLKERQKEMNEELQGLSEEERAAKQKEMQKELQELQQELVQQAAEEANKDITSMAKDLGFDVVINSDGIITGEEELSAEDITEDLIVKMKEKYDLI